MTNGIAGTIIAAAISAEFRHPWPRKSIHAAIGTAMLIAIADRDGTGCRRSPCEYDDSPVMARKTPHTGGHPNPHSGEHLHQMQPEPRYPHLAPNRD